MNTNPGAAGFGRQGALIPPKMDAVWAPILDKNGVAEIGLTIWPLQTWLFALFFRRVWWDLGLTALLASLCRSWRQRTAFNTVWTYDILPSLH